MTPKEAQAQILEVLRQRIAAGRPLALREAAPDRDGDTAFVFRRLLPHRAVRRLLIEEGDFSLTAHLDDVTGPGGGYVLCSERDNFLEVMAVIPRVANTKETSSKEDLMFYSTALRCQGDRRTGRLVLDSDHDLNVVASSLLPLDATLAQVASLGVELVRRAIFTTASFHSFVFAFGSGATAVAGDLPGKLLTLAEALCMDAGDDAI